MVPLAYPYTSPMAEEAFFSLSSVGIYEDRTECLIEWDASQIDVKGEAPLVPDSISSPTGQPRQMPDVLDLGVLNGSQIVLHEPDRSHGSGATLYIMMNQCSRYSDRLRLHYPEVDPSKTMFEEFPVALRGAKQSRVEIVLNGMYVLEGPLGTDSSQTKDAVFSSVGLSWPI